MSYGFGLAGEGIGAWTEGVRQNQEAEARREERRINQLYTRYQLSAARRKDAEQAYQEHASAVGEAASGSPQEGEVYNARDEERKLRATLYDTLSGKGSQPKGVPKGPKGWLYRALGVDETTKATEEGYDSQPQDSRYPMDERLPDGRSVNEAISGSAPGFRIGSNQEPMPTAPGTERRYSMNATPSETAPGTAPMIKAKTLEAMSTPGTAPIAGADQIPQDVEDTSQGQFAPEGRVQAGLTYQFPGQVQPKSGSEIRSGLAQKLPMADPKTLDSATKLRVQKEADNILQNLEGYVDHVKRTKRADDDSFEFAQGDASFNKYLGALKSLEANGYLKANTVDEFLDKSFQDSPSRMRARPIPTAAQAEEDKFFKSIGQPGGPKDYQEALRLQAQAKASPRSSSERGKLEADAIKQRLGSINPKTQKPYTAWEVLQELPRSAAVGADDSGPLGGVISGTDPDTGENITARLPKTGQPGTAAVPMTGIKPKVTKTSRSELMIEAPQFVTGPDGKPTGLHPFRGRKILSAQAIIDAFNRDPNSMTWDDVHRYAETPEMFEDPGQLELLKKLIKRYENMRPERRSKPQEE